MTDDVPSMLRTAISAMPVPRAGAEHIIDRARRRRRLAGIAATTAAVSLAVASLLAITTMGGSRGDDFVLTSDGDITSEPGAPSGAPDTVEVSCEDTGFAQEVYVLQATGRGVPLVIENSGSHPVEVVIGDGGDAFEPGSRMESVLALAPGTHDITCWGESGDLTHSAELLVEDSGGHWLGDVGLDCIGGTTMTYPSGEPQVSPEEAARAALPTAAQHVELVQAGYAESEPQWLLVREGEATTASVAVLPTEGGWVATSTSWCID